MPTRKKPGKRDLINVGGEEVFAENQDAIRSIPLEAIVTNDSNPREACPTLWDLGYGIFERRHGANKKCLRELAFSDDPAERASFVELIEHHEGKSIESDDGSTEVKQGLPVLAESLVVNGWIHPARVRPITQHENKDFIGKYDLIVGCRRYLAMLYLSVKQSQKYPIRAVVTNESDDKSRHMALDENLTVLAMSPAQIIRNIEREHKNLHVPIEVLAKKYSTNTRTIQRRLNAAAAGEDLLARLERKEVGITDVETIGYRVSKGEPLEKASKEVLARPTRRGNKGKGGGGGGRPAGTTNSWPSSKKAKEIYESDESVHEKARQWIASMLNIDYESREQIKMKKGSGK